MLQKVEKCELWCTCFITKTEESFPTREREELPNRAKNFGREQERERKSKKKTATKKSKQQHKSVKMGELDIFVLFLSICGLKWLLFEKEQHNLYPSNTPHEKKRKKTRRKKW